MGRPKPLKELPEGDYTVNIVRVRKVRNKPQYRIFMHCVETDEDISMVIRP